MTLLYKAQTRFLFHAHIKLKIPVFSPDSCFDTLFGVLERIDRRYNSYQEGSYIDRINKQAGHFVEVDDTTVSLLHRTIFWSDFFNGAFDITVMPLIRLWGFYKESQLSVPSLWQLETVRKKVDYKQIEIEGNRVRIAEGQEIITGSFLKAYAVDCMIAQMKRMGIEDALVNAGGSTIYAINNNFHPYWNVNVRHPETDELLFTLKISNQCYTTSSQRETFVSIDGKRYGHILNPLTGYPSGNRQLGLLTSGCMDGDIVSTGLFLQTPSEFSHSLQRLQLQMPVEGYLLDRNGVCTESDGFNAYK